MFSFKKNTFHVLFVFLFLTSGHAQAAQTWQNPWKIWSIKKQVGEHIINYKTAEFRNIVLYDAQGKVRPEYDRYVLCGEVDSEDPMGKRTGYKKFVFFGDHLNKEDVNWDEDLSAMLCR